MFLFFIIKFEPIQDFLKKCDYIYIYIKLHTTPLFESYCISLTADLRRLVPEGLKSINVLALKSDLKSSYDWLKYVSTLPTFRIL